MKRKIVFINQATGYLTIDIINKFAGEFGRVDLITGSIRVQETPLANSVRVSRIIRYDRGNNFRKALSWIIATIQIYFLLEFRYKNFEIFYITVPPTAYLTAGCFKRKYAIMIMDLYPEALVANGYSRRSFIYRYWSARNRKIFAGALIIYTLSENMRKQILDYSPSANVAVIPNWSAFSGFKPIPKEENHILWEEGLLGKFIVQYSGNIGVTHNVETLVDVATNLQENSDLVFLIIGRGEKAFRIGEMINERKLSNCRLLPYRKDEDLYMSLCTADIAVVLLDNKTSDISVPSKIYNIMSAGVPFLAVADMNSEISKIVSGHNIGKSFEKNDIKGMSEYILEMKRDVLLKKKYSENSLAAAGLYSSENADRYLEYYLKSGNNYKNGSY